MPIHSITLKETWRAAVCAMSPLFFAAMVSCSSNDSFDEVIEGNDPLSPELTVIHEVNGLGDRGYNDAIHRGLRQGKNSYDYRLQMCVPDTYDEAEQAFLQWIEAPNEGRRRLMVLGADSYDFLVEKYADRIPDNDSAQVLWLESRRRDLPVHTLYMSLYGAAYTTAALTALLPHADSCAIVCGTTFAEGAMADVVQGFNHAMQEKRGTQAKVFSLAADASGFNMADSLYHKCFTLEQTYGFVLPVAGGSNEGLYRFTREYPHTFYTAGMDGDYSEHSPTMFVSIVKHIDQAVLETVGSWMAGEPLPRHQRPGLESGMVEVMPSTYGVIEGIETPIAELRPEAIEKENAYEKDK